jgi:hypothetical protein
MRFYNSKALLGSAMFHKSANLPVKSYRTGSEFANEAIHIDVPCHRWKTGPFYHVKY